MKKIIILSILSVSNLIHCDIEDELSRSPQSGTFTILPYNVYASFQKDMIKLQNKIDQTRMDLETLRGTEGYYQKRNDLINALNRNQVEIRKDIEDSIQNGELSAHLSATLNKQLTDLRKEIINLRKQ
jgi:hypothetical protein